MHSTSNYLRKFERLLYIENTKIILGRIGFLSPLISPSRKAPGHQDPELRGDVVT